MSFAKDIKLQILKQPLKNDCCELAFLSGLLHASGEWDLGKKTVSLLTDIPEIYNFCNRILNHLYGDVAELEIGEGLKINKTKYYCITLPKTNITQILQDTGILNQEKMFNFEHIDDNLLQEDCCNKSFIKGVFVGSGTSAIRISENQLEKTSTGYGLEFISHSHAFLLEFSNLLARFNILPKIVQRKKQFVLYIKESSQVSDLLALMEAFDSVIKLQDELSLRELRNKVNRQTNCVNANISKVVEASMKQMEAIKNISYTIGLEYLPMDLQEVALLRLANPEESLGELLNLSNLKLTKSGLNHRLNKIIKISHSLNS